MYVCMQAGWDLVRGATEEAAAADDGGAAAKPVTVKKNQIVPEDAGWSGAGREAEEEEEEEEDLVLPEDLSVKILAAGKKATGLELSLDEVLASEELTQGLKTLIAKGGTKFEGATEA